MYWKLSGLRLDTVERTLATPRMVSATLKCKNKDGDSPLLS